MKLKILLALAAVFVIIQFFRPEKNLSNDESNSIKNAYVVPQHVETILQKACNDCHSNKTDYPWYANIQPVAWWLNNHIEEGKDELNFSTFTTRRIASQNHKFEEIVELVENGEMPLPSYTWLGLHPEAKLSDEEKATIITWAEEQMNQLKQKYPADSLVVRRPNTPI
ncbi:MAG TPA: heme-binding domain-containing protein [Chryseolinea sp.]